ncbi:MAG: 2-succinyl-5-enolpyruvyl-6-hydroxy-3-cyclohexene-1-carboxylic-acid synthase [Ignavibacteriales bacterium]|nr:MAG: 2-succinyl-5-enolpyruvyl-6-hydroxy-3-cyclohexene-1-carboxylic-acid synthase [Ignavibacteriaceae bacterium]MBW7871877.1 2-succinyl-5-enolpyruvyl-6-hydroxy-3-cyclohexene-1-carboxylic-acid synthase [Ignavibacteria bacterium]MCZ2144273.1 2-succinyl-5-enolpyruvyl-6-hydroxy-3-cyclohexene-1-carboxylic-acid synthase [Ignavibacteriales bacterium]OQY71796.1 MAG: 2-succinyl-5-enolpyruvyl-6-hydroxy-3-cyclohexene-1-carboxylic-acid synthase [Ignavibacteriales bacterium UTCHB3]MBV6446226.1 2-succinyl-
MKTNLNYFRSRLIVRTLIKLGLDNVCISPGSRNTPLTMAFAAEKELNKHPIIDERASGFFALGLAKSTGKPVAVVCTSGTAVAELYPAIIEAHNSRLSLIILTADRPPYLRNSGSNQTINQNQIYAANCDHYFDLGLPENSEEAFVNTIKVTASIWENSIHPYNGPVHVNIPFEKPLEPGSVDTEINEEILRRLKERIDGFPGAPFPREFSKNINLLIGSEENVLVVLGNAAYSAEFIKKCAQFSDKFKIPVCVEAPWKLPGLSNQPFVRNFGNLLLSKNFKKMLDFDKIIVFGRNFTSKNIERFFSRWNKALINISVKGEGLGKPADNKLTVQINDMDAINSLLSSETGFAHRRTASYQFIKKIDKVFSDFQKESFKELSINSEVELTAGIAQLLQDKEDIPVFFSNSLPVRDFDYVRELFRNRVFVNRGASGIDGIIATAAGVSTGFQLPTVLVIGDLAFHYDNNSLQLVAGKKIPLLILLINNGGGSIFEYLPVFDEVLGETSGGNPRGEEKSIAHLSVEKTTAEEFIGKNTADETVRKNTADETGGKNPAEKKLSNEKFEEKNGKNSPEKDCFSGEELNRTDDFKTFFKTDTGLDFQKIAAAYGIKQREIKSEKDLSEAFTQFFDSPEPTLIEVKFDSVASRRRKDALKEGIISSVNNSLSDFDKYLATEQNQQIQEPDDYLRNRTR